MGSDGNLPAKWATITNVSSTKAWLTQRAASIAPGTQRRILRARALSGASSFGRHQIGVRWNTVSCSTSGAIAGMTWIADAPVPITATRLPARSAE